jgi:hypothetical protein
MGNVTGKYISLHSKGGKMWLPNARNKMKYMSEKFPYYWNGGSGNIHNHKVINVNLILKLILKGKMFPFTFWNNLIYITENYKQTLTNSCFLNVRTCSTNGGEE